MSTQNVQQDMQVELREAFSLAKYQTDQNLSEDIWCGLVNRNKKIALIKLWVFGSALFLSFIGTVEMLITLSKNLNHSGFYEYFSLMFSDMKSVASMWKEFALLIAESLPVINIMTSVVLVFIFLWSLRYVMKQIIIKNQLSTGIIY